MEKLIRTRYCAKKSANLIFVPWTMREPKKKYHTREQALQKLQRYCAYQDRCHAEVRTKLLSLGIYGDDLEEIIVELIGENYLNEERFARSYARGKFRFKCWGRIRITQELKSRRISDYLIRKALEEIDETEYRQALYDLLDKKLALISADNDFEKKLQMVV